MYKAESERESCVELDVDVCYVVKQKLHCSYITMPVSKLLKRISSLDGTQCYSYMRIIMEETFQGHLMYRMNFIIQHE